MPAVGNTCVNTNPGVNAFANPESQLSPVAQAAGGPPVKPASDVVVCGVDVMVHRTVSPAEIVVMAVTRIPPVLLVQSTNPISAGLDPPQGGAMSPILTLKVAAWVQEVPIKTRLDMKIPSLDDNFPHFGFFMKDLLW